MRGDKPRAAKAREPQNQEEKHEKRNVPAGKGGEKDFPDIRKQQKHGRKQYEIDQGRQRGEELPGVAPPEPNETEGTERFPAEPAVPRRFLARMGGA